VARGFGWGRYVDDVGRNWALKVDADYLGDPDRGWTAATPSEAPFPRGWLPRQVVGLDEFGFLQRTRVPSTTSPLWTGAVSTFRFNATDQLEHLVQVTGFQSERLTPKPKAA
jgi:hypothetical protein